MTLSVTPRLFRTSSMFQTTKGVHIHIKVKGPHDPHHPHDGRDGRSWWSWEKKNRGPFARSFIVLKFRCHSRHLPISLLPKGRLPIKNYRQSSISKMDSSYYNKKYQTNVFVPFFYLFFCIYWQGFFHHQTLTFFEALTSSDVLILMSSIDHLISLDFC